MFSPLQPHILWKLGFYSTKGLRVGILTELANSLGIKMEALDIIDKVDKLGVSVL